MRRPGVSRRLALAAIGVLGGLRTSAATGAGSDRGELLLKAEAELEHGDTAAALDDFERAALIVHASDAELGAIRAAMQSGQYRRALGFCAHTAGEHLDAPEAGALYAWLLRAGGQPALAERVLADTVDRDPRAAVPAAVREAFRSDPPVATGVLLAPPHRMAPWPTVVAGQAPLPRTARPLTEGGVLVGDGSRALVPRTALADVAGARLWVRNALGETTEAVAYGDDPVLSAAGLAVLDLRSPLATGGTAEAAEPFAGSPGHALSFAPRSEAAWPWLAQGFFGGVDAPTGLRKLGFDVGDAAGAAVLDGAGRLAGTVVSAGAGRPALWMPAARWASAPGLRTVAAARSAGHSLTAPDAVYEAGMRRPLQLIAELAIPNG